MNWVKRPTIALLLLLFVLPTWSQSVTEEVTATHLDINSGGPPLLKEKILKLSPRGRVLILSNNHSSYARGDFISLLFSDQLVIRCLVAKLHNGRAGLKITKIYNLPLWKKIRPNLEVQVIRGDDSYFLARNKVKKEGKASSLIEEEEDLYNETTLLEEDLELDKNKNRVIGTDNLITMVLSFVEGVDVSGRRKRYNQISGSWMYQLADNIWGDASYGQSIINNYPSSGLDTRLSNLSLKIKYTIAAPFFSYIQPYAGYQLLMAFSPGAGEPDGTTSQSDLAEEVKKIEKLKRGTAIFGLTVLKRLVPGWLLRVDVGSDAINVGFGLEF